MIETSSTKVVFFSFAILGAFFLLFGIFWFSWRYGRRPTALSPYSGMPLRRGSDLSYFYSESVLRYLYQMRDPNNPMFDLRKAAMCRETGRIFPNGINWFDVINVDWDFLKKRRPGNYVSWGSLSVDQKEHLTKIHHDLSGYQTEFSSENPLPRAVEPKYAMKKPGPLYVDINNYVLLGWKIVPETELEVLIVKHPTPKRTFFTPISEEDS
ncbi:MAG: hypothetical protein H0W50_03215 [Parachlamydiaceae bacterium]|nr:hypothetical protein [Parachlamydiaceae bacterium]